MMDVVRTLCIFSFLSILDTLFLHCDSKPCTLIDIYIEVVITFFHLSLYMLFLFFLYAHAYILRLLLHSFTNLFMCCFFSLFMHMLLIYCMQFLFLFHTKMPWWVLFKVFQKYRTSKSSCHKLSFCKVFQEFVLGYILLYSTSEYELGDLWLLSYVRLFVVVLSRIARGRDC